MEVELSIVSPVYRGAECVKHLVARIEEAVSQFLDAFEIVLVDDGSPDDAWARIEEVCRENPRVKGVKLSRNFGQHFAITAGFATAKGRYVALMDCDLQDDPVYLRKLYDVAKTGIDVVLTSKRQRAHSWMKNLQARFYGKVLNVLVQGKAPAFREDVGSYSLLSRKVVDAFLQMPDRQRHYLALLRWLGFQVAYVDIEHRARLMGRSSYTFAKLVSHAVDGIVSQSGRLLYVSVAVGFGIFLLSLFAAAYLVVTYFLHGYKEGWTSTMVVSLGSTGMILMSVGIVGIYVGKTFEQAKQRPLYVIDKTLNLND